MSIIKKLSFFGWGKKRREWLLLGVVPRARFFSYVRSTYIGIHTLLHCMPPVPITLGYVKKRNLFRFYILINWDRLFLHKWAWDLRNINMLWCHDQSPSSVAPAPVSVLIFLSDMEMECEENMLDRVVFCWQFAQGAIVVLIRLRILNHAARFFKWLYS